VNALIWTFSLDIVPPNRSNLKLLSLNLLLCLIVQQSRKQRTDIGKYSFVNKTIQLWNQRPADALGTLSYKSSHFRKRVRKVINKVKWRWGENHPKMQWSEVKRSEAKRSEVKWSEVKWSVARMWRVRKCGEAEGRDGHGEVWVHQFMTLSITLLLLYSVYYTYFFNIIYLIVVVVLFVVVIIVFIVYSVSFIVCVVLCVVFCLSVVCYLCVASYCLSVLLYHCHRVKTHLQFK
jgi:hypothetical protein